ncbi:MAG TPA: hypothetical protein VLC08_01810 [Chitinolyticbacter sp.]|nr:hypothetical protein [Chitinolyticbacter sp.]
MVFVRTLMLLVLTANMHAAMAADSPYNPAKLAELDRQRCEKLINERALIDKRLTRERKPYNVRKMEARRDEIDAEYARYGRCAKVMVPTPAPTPTTPAVTPARTK